MSLKNHTHCFCVGFYSHECFADLPLPIELDDSEGRSMTKRSLALLATIPLCTSFAFAADLPTRRAPPVYVPPPQLLTWQGFYAGANFGYIEGSRESFLGTQIFNNGGAGSPALAAAVASGVTNTVKPSGFLGGGQIGYNWQFNSYVLGVETDFDGSTARGSVQPISLVPLAGTAPALSLNSTVNEQARISYFGTLRGRAGYLVQPNFLIFATGGLAYARMAASFAVNDTIPAFVVPPFGATGGAGSTRVGYTVGGGLEYMFLPNWSLKAEALYYDLGTQSVSGAFTSVVPGGPPVTTTAISASRRLDGFVARAGLNYHFNFTPAPVVARY